MKQDDLDVLNKRRHGLRLPQIKSSEELVLELALKACDEASETIRKLKLTIQNLRKDSNED